MAKDLEGGGQGVGETEKADKNPPQLG